MKKSILIFLGLWMVVQPMYSQAKLAFSLGNPIIKSSTQIQWDIYIQNVSESNEVVSISTTNLPHVTHSGNFIGAENNPLSLVLEPDFKSLILYPKIFYTSNLTSLRLNGGEVPEKSSLVSTQIAKFGTVILSSKNPISFPMKLGFSASVPNVSVSGYSNGTPITFQLSKNNLELLNTLDNFPLQFDESKLTQIETNNLENIKVFPNPTSGFINLDLSKINLKKDEVDFSMYDMTTKKVISKTFLDNNIELIDVTRLPAGMYNVMVRQGSTLYREKIIKID